MLSGIWSVYLLVSGTRTYIGATTDPHRRLRQHNGEIVGGARSTRGRKWELVLWVEGFRNRSECYRWEKLAKLRARGLTKRIEALVLISAGKCPEGKRHYPVPKELTLNLGRIRNVT